MRAPRDGGLSGLALLMTFIGTVTTTVTCTVGVVIAMLLISFIGPTEYSHDSSSIAGWIMLALITSGVRAAMHRNAGTTLLSRHGNRPVAGVYRYIAASTIQAMVLITWCALSWPLPMTVALALLCMAWPVSILVMLRLPRFRQFAVAVPAAEDRGFEGASILMALFGGAGLATIALVVAHDSDGAHSHVALYLIATCLVVRSTTQLGAGIVGMRNADTEHVARVAKRYTDIAMVTLVVATLAMFGMVMFGRVDGSSMVLFLVFAGILLVGPLTIHRFFAPERLLPSNDLPELRTTRAPDRGVSTWGWALLGMSVMTIAIALPMTIWSGAVPDELGRALPVATRSVLSTPLPLCTLLVASMQLVAAVALITVHARHRLVTLSYGALALVMAFTVGHAPTLVNEIVRYPDSRLIGDSGLIVMVVLANLLLLPLTSLFVVLRPTVQRL